MPEDEMFDDLRFENELDSLGDNQPALIKFVAVQQHKSSKVLADHGKRIKTLENKNKKVMGAIGATGAIIATAVAATLDYFVRRG